MTAEQGSPTTNTSGDGRPAQSGDARGNGERPTAERVRPSVSATQAGIALLAEFPARPRGLYFRAADLIAAIEAEARQQALTDAIAAVEGMLERNRVFGDCSVCDRPQGHGFPCTTVPLTRLRDGS